MCFALECQYYLAGMLAVLCSAPRPSLGVALLGLFITMLNWALHLLPYVLFCSMIALSVLPPLRPLFPEVMYYPVYGQPNQVHVVYASPLPSSTSETRSLKLGAVIRILVFLLALPVSSIAENILFFPVRNFFLQTVECWFDMRYVQPAQATGIWPGVWTPIVNALRSSEFLAKFIDGLVGKDSCESLQTRMERALRFQPKQIRVRVTQGRSAMLTCNLPIRTPD
ncbi:hypothetical protein B0F90DRAFT_850579 [Multifurca ochricompacta]|uniref:Uncharacterized protein n=1 Tax=Multifurca ochricompacta TaxID=376703 RepID=A0AAD4QJG1_9AGAM|nr:hypothetical protein B0F90DRAFT_850579 [Multifurca ochricompacta]